MQVNELMRNYCQNPVLVIIDPKPVELGLPTKAYISIEEVKADGTEKSQKSFAHVTSEIGAVEVRGRLIVQICSCMTCFVAEDMRQMIWWQ